MEKCLVSLGFTTREPQITCLITEKARGEATIKKKSPDA